MTDASESTPFPEEPWRSSYSTDEEYWVDWQAWLDDAERWDAADALAHNDAVDAVDAERLEADEALPDGPLTDIPEIRPMDRSDLVRLLEHGPTWLVIRAMDILAEQSATDETEPEPLYAYREHRALSAELVRRGIPLSILRAFIEAGDAYYSRHVPIERKSRWARLCEAWNADDGQAERTVAGRWSLRDTSSGRFAATKAKGGSFEGVRREQ